MEVQSITKYVRMSQIKLRDVAREVQGLKANKALEILKFIPRKSARLIYKTLKSAVANAENNHNLNSDVLIIKDVLIEQGPSLKRFRPSARGMAHPYRKSTSHIRAILKAKE